MVPYNHTEFIGILVDLVKEEVIPISRINDAVSRILQVKFRMGLFENPLADNSLAGKLGCQVSCSSPINVRMIYGQNYTVLFKT